MIYKASQETVDKYFQNTGYLSSTLLKSFIKGYDYYLATKREMEEEGSSDKYFDEPKDHFIIGSALDMSLTHVESDFTSNYYISTLSEKPSETEISIIKYVYDKRITQIPLGEGITPVTMGNFLDHTNLLTEAFDYHKYQPRYGFDAKKKAFDNTKVSTYWNELLLSANRQIITLEDLVLINALKGAFLNSSTTSYIFRDSDNIDIFYQVPVYVRINNVRCKILIDMVVVDYERRIITLYDIKTMNDGVMLFPNDFRKRRYDIQAGFYHYVSTFNNSLILSLRVNYTSDTRKREILDFCMIDDFKFIVGSKSFPNSTPVVYSVGMEKLNEIINGKKKSYSTCVTIGGDLVSKVYPEVLGIKDLVVKLQYSIDQGYDYRCEDGVINLSSD